MARQRAAAATEDQRRPIDESIRGLRQVNVPYKLEALITRDAEDYGIETYATAVFEPMPGRGLEHGGDMAPASSIRLQMRKGTTRDLHVGRYYLLDISISPAPGSVD